jgi:hypothetical protein
MPSPGQIAALFGGDPKMAASLMQQPSPLSQFFAANGIQGWNQRTNREAQTAYGEVMRRTGNTDQANAAWVHGLVGNPKDNPILGAFGAGDIGLAGGLMGTVKSADGLFNLPIKNKTGEDVGQIVGSEGFDSFTVHNSGIDDAASRGQGLGLKGYQELADHALSNGKALRSDTEVTVDAARMYEALARRGYKIERNPNAKLEDVNGTKKWVAPSRSWGVFRVVGGPQK